MKPRQPRYQVEDSGWENSYYIFAEYYFLKYDKLSKAKSVRPPQKFDSDGHDQCQATLA